MISRTRIPAVSELWFGTFASNDIYATAVHKHDSCISKAAIEESKMSHLVGALVCLVTTRFKRRAAAGKHSSTLPYAHFESSFQDGKLYGNGAMSISTGRILTCPMCFMNTVKTLQHI